MAVPFTFANTPGGTKIPLSELDQNFTYLDNEISSKSTTVSAASVLGLAAGSATGPAQSILMNNITAVATGSTATRSLANRFADVINVKDFGAKGDGVSDDTAAIQAALDSSVGLPRTIFFPSGTYIIGAAGLAGNSNQHWTGEGDVTLKLDQNPSGDFIRFYGRNNFSVDGFTIDYNNKIPAGVNSAFGIASSDSFSLTNSRIININKFGIGINGATNFIVSNNYIEKNTAAITQNQAIVLAASLVSYNGVFDNNHCVRSGTDFSGYNLRITNNIIEQWGFGGGITTETNANCNKNFIGFNICKNSQSVRDVNNFVISGIENWGADSVIIGNIIYGNAGAGMDQGGKNCIVANNTIFNNSTYAPALYFGISARYGSGGSGPTYNCSGSVYVGNKCYNSPDLSATQGYGYVEQSASLSNIKLIGNSFDNNATGDVIILSPTTSMVAQTNGKVGINNASPAYTLDVNGTINATGNITAPNLLSQWNGKTVVVLGDSISSLDPWVSAFMTPLGATVTNYSRNGRTMQNVLTNPNGTALTSSNFNNVSAVNLLCGVNDYVAGTALGTINDAPGAATFYGYTKQVVETVLGWNNTCIFVMNTMPYFNYNDGVTTWNYYTTANGSGSYGYQYNQALKDVAAYYGLYLNDLFNTVQFNSVTIGLFAGVSGTPPYPGSANLPGTVSTSSTTVTGVGTNFLTFFRLGDRIIVNSEARQVMTLPSDTSMTVDVAFSTSYSSQNYQKKYYSGDGLHPTTQGYQMMTNAAKGFYTGLIYPY